MILFKKREKKYKPTDFVIVEKWGATFKTVDGEEHSFRHNFYIDPNTIRCSVPEWIMIDGKHDGYIMVGETAYPLQNIISIDWHCAEKCISLCKWESKACNISAIYYFSQNIEESEKILSDGKYDELIKEIKNNT